MKQQTLFKKLVLNKETVSHLGNTTMAEIRGGYDTQFICLSVDVPCTSAPRPTCVSGCNTNTLVCM